MALISRYISTLKGRMVAAFVLLFVLALFATLLVQWVSSQKQQLNTQANILALVNLQFTNLNETAQKVLSYQSAVKEPPTLVDQKLVETLRAEAGSLYQVLANGNGNQKDSNRFTPAYLVMDACNKLILCLDHELNKESVSDSQRSQKRMLLLNQGMVVERLCQINNIQTFGAVRLAEGKLAEKTDTTTVHDLEKNLERFEQYVKFSTLRPNVKESILVQFAIYVQFIFQQYSGGGMPWWQNTVFLGEVRHFLSSLSFQQQGYLASQPAAATGNRLFSHNTLSLVVIGFTIMASLGISIHYSRELTIPVRRLAHQVENMVNSNFQRISREALPTTIAELQQLNNSVYLMASTIQENLEMIGRKNEDLANLYHETLDNINTARTIQHSLLPPVSEVQKALPESFVLNRPKDIVSGDFYWIDNSSDVLKLAVADCTGHGVAGAFMSFVGHSLLTRIAEETPIFFDAASILDRLNDGVRQTLRQAEDGSHTQNGMDISLVCIDFYRGVLHFAGANQTLYLVRNGELNTIKSNKFSIGGPVHRNNVVFTNHKVAFVPGDVVYLTSDGFADQIGGPTGDEKFKTSRLRTLFQNVHALRMEEQGKVLSKVLEQWLGPNPLLDDVLVVGFRIPEM